MLDVLLAQVQALKKQVESLSDQVLALDRLANLLATVHQASVCDHPEEAWKNQGTFGNPDWRCELCHARINEAVEQAVEAETNAGRTVAGG